MHGQCELVGIDGERCPSPLPPPAVDEQGRRRGGKPSKYCTKAHADTASRLRRRAAATVTDEGLRHAAEMADRLEPVLREQATGTTALLELLTEVRDGAIGRVQAAESGEADAQREARETEVRAEAAERDKGLALARARDAADAQARAEQARNAAERGQLAATERADAAVSSERLAWQDNTALTDKLGRCAEAQLATAAARDAAERDRALLTERLRTESAAHADQVTAVRAQLDALRADNHDLAARVVEADTARAAAEQLASQATARATDADRRTEESRSAADRARLDLATAQADATAVRNLLARTEAALETIRTESIQLRERAATAELLRVQAQQRLIELTPAASDETNTAH